ncbi:hypothetical protein A2U01_0029515, partial [Trifolium medium]|nr:hypothetical protein [Trifolium medium]
MNFLLSHRPSMASPTHKRALMVGMGYLNDFKQKSIPCFDHDVFGVKDFIEERYAFNPNNIQVMFDADYYFTENPTAENVYNRLLELVLQSKYGNTL